MAFQQTVTRMITLAALLILLAPGTPAETSSVVLQNRSASVKQLEAQTLIDAPPHMVWQVITDYNGLKNVLPGYEKSQIVANAGSQKTVDVVLKASALAPAFRYRIKIQENRASNMLNIQRVSGDFNAINASYRLIPQVSGKTLLVYKLNIDLGDSVPKIGAGHILKANTEKGMQALGNYCQQQYKRSLTAKR